MRLRFSAGEVTLRGCALQALFRHRAEGDLESLQSVPLRYAWQVDRKPVIVSIQVQRMEDAWAAPAIESVTGLAIVPWFS